MNNNHNCKIEKSKHFADNCRCSSPIGMQYAGNFIRLAGGCFSHGTLLHEIAHTLGIWHEQNRPDRDQYIKIRPENMACCKYIERNDNFLIPVKILLSCKCSVSEKQHS